MGRSAPGGPARTCSIVAPYIADARALQMVLLGGQTGAEVEGHDWEYLLTRLGWLRFDLTLGIGARRIGLLMMVASVIWAAVVTARARQAPDDIVEG